MSSWSLPSLFSFSLFSVDTYIIVHRILVCGVSFFTYSQQLLNLRGGGCKMNFEFLTFPCREMMKLSIHMLRRFQNESIHIQNTHLLRDVCIAYIAKLQMRFRPLGLCIFLNLSHVSVPFSWLFVGRIE